MTKEKDCLSYNQLKIWKLVNKVKKEIRGYEKCCKLVNDSFFLCTNLLKLKRGLRPKVRSELGPIQEKNLKRELLVIFYNTIDLFVLVVVVNSSNER
ncbi:hypothetical protein Bca4012_101302 [Brassica carinata]|uniref:Uncharacterized protein n=2 Tax=Brassica TaxID=3705 RepID=A0A3P6HD08_BRAOL|nr:unnamed protein product [Brassica napus]VDD63809.1 unnamed protein product [Brassica oleracea]